VDLAHRPDAHAGDDQAAEDRAQDSDSHDGSRGDASVQRVKLQVQLSLDPHAALVNIMFIHQYVNK
jgi:hypothetical protein